MGSMEGSPGSPADAPAHACTHTHISATSRMHAMCRDSWWSIYLGVCPHNTTGLERLGRKTPEHRSGKTANKPNIHHMEPQRKSGIFNTILHEQNLKQRSAESSMLPTPDVMQQKGGLMPGISGLTGSEGGWGRRVLHGAGDAGHRSSATLQVVKRRR